jgi:hypothetical protein
MLVELAHHLARCYAREGVKPIETSQMIREGFDFRWCTPAELPMAPNDARELERYHQSFLYKYRNTQCYMDRLCGFTGQMTDELIAFESDYRVDSNVLVFEQAMDQNLAREADRGVTEKESLTETERSILIVETVEREVNNSGYDQFLFNCGEEFADVMEAAFRRIGYPKSADTAKDTLRIHRDFGEDIENEERAAQLSALDEAFFN